MNKGFIKLSAIFSMVVVFILGAVFLFSQSSVKNVFATNPFVTINKTITCGGGSKTFSGTANYLGDTSTRLRVTFNPEGPSNLETVVDSTSEPTNWSFTRTVSVGTEYVIEAKVWDNTNGDGSPEDTESWTFTPVACPTPTVTPSPTLTPTPTATPSATPSPTPTPSEEPKGCEEGYHEVDEQCVPDERPTPTPTPSDPCAPGTPFVGPFCGWSPKVEEQKPTAPVCTNGAVVALPANAHVIRDGAQATVNLFVTEGDSVNIYWRVVGESAWVASSAAEYPEGVKPNGDHFATYTAKNLDPNLGYEFGVQQKQGCGGGGIYVIVDGPAPQTFYEWYWEWTK